MSPGGQFRMSLDTLATCEVLTRPDTDRLRTRTVRDLKRALAPAALVENSWADVWALPAADSDTFLEAGPDDLFAVHVNDHTSATSGASLTGMPTPKWSMNAHRISTTLMARDPPGSCT